MRGHSPSLLIRITTRLVAITLATTAASYAWLYYQLDYAADRVTERGLVSQAFQLGKRLHVDPATGRLELTEIPAENEVERDGRLRYAVTDSRAVIRAGSPWPAAPLSAVALSADDGGLYEFRHNQPKDKAFYGALVQVPVGGKTYTIQVERSSGNMEPLMDTLLEEFFKHGAWVSIPFLLILLAVSFFTIRGAITPLNELSNQASSIGPASTDMRLSEEGVPKEIIGLVRAVNLALDRLDAGFRAQREFTADAAHELRTPMAILRAHVETLVDPKAARALAEDFDRVARVVSDLLCAAQLDTLSADENEHCDLAELAIETAGLLLPLATARGRVLMLTGADKPVPVRANRTHAMQALRNLIENAIFHSADDGAITIRVAERSISVADTGVGLPANQREKVFQRFWRAKRSGSGSGLGLAIVKRTMEVYGGGVELSETPGGGATFTLRFAAPGPGVRGQAAARRPDRPVSETAAA